MKQKNMNKIILNYLLKNFLKTFCSDIYFYCFGVILNLFEEIEFFKNMECFSIYTTNFNEYLYTKYYYKNFTIHNFHLKFVVYVEFEK